MKGVWAIVVAAGSGSRFGGMKQFEVLGGLRVIDHAVAATKVIAEGVVVVVPADRVNDPLAQPDALVVAGGASRSDSVRAGLSAVPEAAEVVVVHDAARPFASAGLFTAVVEAVRTEGVDAAIPGVAVADTVKQVRDGIVVATLNRSELVAVQTPQAFRAASLRQAHQAGGEATDDAALVEGAGGRVVVVEGEAANRKLTTAADLDWAQALLARA